MASAGQIPMGLQMAVSAPLGVRAYRRRFQSPMTNVQAAGPDNHINIYPDTSTPGAFIDHESTYLSFDFTIKNKEFGVDFTDFGVEGAAGAIIQEWRVHNQGTILEEILDYPVVAAALANAEGAYELESTMYFSSKLRGGYQSDAHRNFIKPPMVSGSGNIMFGPNPFGVGPSVANPLGEIPVYRNKGTATYGGSGLIAFNPQGLVSAQVSAYTPGSHTYNDMITAHSTTQGNFSVFHNLRMSNAQTDKGPRPDGVDAAKWAGHISPAAFPDFFSPSMVDIVRNKYVQEFGTINKVQVMANLCNVKCFPIGMAPATNCFSSSTAMTSADLASSTVLTPLAKATAPEASNPTYRICYRPLSGIFGKMATKMLATTLLAPQQMYISIRLAQAAHVFNVSADPCRRIAGTIRDFVRNVGTRNGGNYGGTTFTLTDGVADFTNPTTSDYAPGYRPGSAPSATEANLCALVTNTGCEGRDLVISRIHGLTDNNRKIADNVPVLTSKEAAGGCDVGGIVAGIPKPQYVLTKEPWKYNCLKAAGGQIDYATEIEVFYGTYLDASEPQSRRCLGMTIDGSVNNALPNISYEVTNMNLVGDQIILPNETTSDVILAAEAGNNNVSTNSVRTYPIQVRNDTTQSIILPLKVNMAKRLFVVFQDQEQRDSTLGFLHDSNCGINPFASISTKGSAITKTGFLSKGTPGSLGGVGVDKVIDYKFNKAGLNQDISVQLRIGNDFYPPQPLTTIQEISTEYVKALEGWQDSTFSPDIDSRVCAMATIGNDLKTTASDLVFDCLQPSKYCTAFVPVELLDDQTITGNPDFVPLHSINTGKHYDNATYGSIFKDEVITDKINGYNMICPRGYCVQGMFKSPSSRFMLGFNLRSFKDIDGVEGGTYLGNNTITLLMSGCHGLAVSNRSYRGIAIVPHRAMMRYSPGGQIVWAY